MGGGPGEQLRYTPRFAVAPEATERLVPNLKWASARGGGIDEEPLREYLRGLVRYIAAEARAKGVSKLDFQWTFPLALPDGVQRGMKQVWHNFGDVFCKESVLDITASAGIAESDAICRRLAYIKPTVVPVSADSLSITIDVGGGSTDVGFWTEDRLIDQVSVKLAGENILDPRLFTLKDFKESFYKACTGNQYHAGLDYGFTERPSIVFNALLTDAKDASGQPFGSGDPRSHPVVRNMPNPGSPPWSIVRSQVFLFYTGITFYVGLHARRHVKTPHVYLYFGGRGSSSLPWITKDADDLARVLAAVFREGLKQEVFSPSNALPVEVVKPAQVERLAIAVTGPSFKYHAALPPKHEVVGGSLHSEVGKKDQKSAGETGPPTELADAAADASQERAEPPVRAEPLGNAQQGSQPRKCVLGELQCRGSNGPLGFYDELTAEGMANVKLPATLDSSHIAVFLGRVLKANLNGLNLDDEHLKELLPESPLIQQYVKDTTRPDGVLQPVFISELRAAMDQYLERATGVRPPQAAAGN
jgi:hypothetical protein